MASSIVSNSNEKEITRLVRLERPDQTFRAALSLVEIPFAALVERENRAPYLHPEEKNYFSKLQFAARQSSYLRGRYCAKLALKEWTGTTMENILVRSGVFNQPLVRAPGVSGVGMSLSHSGDWAAAVVYPEEHPMGIDVEPDCSPHSKAIGARLTPAEQTLFGKHWPANRERGLSWIWTAKEALAKALKTGLTVPLKIYEVAKIVRADGLIHTRYKNFMQYKAVSFFWRGAIVSIALPEKTQIELPFLVSKPK